MAVVNLTESIGSFCPAQRFTPDMPDGAGVLFVHGLYSNSQGYTEFANAAMDLGVSSLTFDLFGHGVSTRQDIGKVTIRDHIEQVEEAFDFLASQPQVDHSRISVVARSYGAYLASRLTQERNVKSLVLGAPALLPDGLDDILHGDLDPSKLFEFQHSALDGVANANLSSVSESLQALSQFEGLVMVVASELDDVIPAQVSRAYADSARNSRLEILAGCGHSLGSEGSPGKEAFKGLLRPWFADLLKVADQ